MQKITHVNTRLGCNSREIFLQGRSVFNGFNTQLFPPALGTHGICFFSVNTSYDEAGKKKPQPKNRPIYVSVALQCLYRMLNSWEKLAQLRFQVCLQEYPWTKKKATWANETPCQKRDQEEMWIKHISKNVWIFWMGCGLIVKVEPFSMSSCSLAKKAESQNISPVLKVREKCCVFSSFIILYIKIPEKC